MALQLPRWRFTADEYEQMGVAGIFDEDERVELLDGDIVQMSPVGPPHVSTVNRLNMLLAPRLGGRAIVQVQSPLKLATHWEPQPDMVLLRERADFYARALPTATDVLLLVEVADSSRAYDRAKWPAYARSGIPEAWLVDLQDELVLCHRDPAGERYQLAQAFRRGESLSPLAFPDLSLPVAGILG